MSVFGWKAVITFYLIHLFCFLRAILKEQSKNFLDYEPVKRAFWDKNLIMEPSSFQMVIKAK